MTSESRRDGIEKLKKTLQQHHWARGLNKETSESIKRGSLITSTKLREGFSLGKIKHWASGKTAEVDPRIADAAKKRSATLRGKSHWNYMSSDEVVERVCQALGDKFDIVSGIDTLAGRKNNTTHHVEIRCKSCSIVTSPSVYDIIRYDKKVCLSCRTEESSIPQKEIEDFVRSLVGSKTVLMSSDRSNPTGYELDVYVPEASFAIEFNGLYWHSEGVRRDCGYHNRKSIACRENDISLLHVFQDEWRDKRQIVESMITNRLGLSKRVWARKCEILEIDPCDSKEFFNKNHIDGDVRGFVTYGLTHEGKIVSAMKLRRPHSKKWSGFVEVARYSCVLGEDVIGGHSKLISHVRRNHSERLISYVDTRFGGTGRHCEKSGMMLDHVSKYSFWWTDRENRFNRLYCKAVDGRSEAEEAKRRKLLKIWGCSNLVFVTS